MISTNEGPDIHEIVHELDNKSQLEDPVFIRVVGEDLYNVDFSEDVADNAGDHMPGLKKKGSDIIKQQCCALSEESSVCESSDSQSLVPEEPSSSDESEILHSSPELVSNYSEDDHDQFNMDNGTDLPGGVSLAQQQSGDVAIVYHVPRN